MEEREKTQITMKVFQKGQIVIPASLRRKYGIEIGDLLDVVPTQEGILLKTPGVKHGKKTKTEELHGIFKTFATPDRILSKKTISSVTAQGYVEGWKE